MLMHPCTSLKKYKEIHLYLHLYHRQKQEDEKVFSPNGTIFVYLES